ncbi:hypothetical protein CDD83_3855 [Cordyceps sp. RAO-2017]|nr:hypothetical protein CDD83_3855 [Cordyceps sp. RAO-2017]
MALAAPPAAATAARLSIRASMIPTQQIRRANFIRRPRRPYVFTQLVQLSDGSTYTMRTTSPAPIYRATKDTRNTLLWRPDEKALRNVELDEAGRLAAFRGRFGRGFDAVRAADDADSADAGTADAADADQGYSDLISDYAPEDTGSMQSSATKRGAGKK